MMLTHSSHKLNPSYTHAHSGWILTVPSDLSSTFNSPTQYHVSRCDDTCTLANSLRQGRTQTKSGNSHAQITCYLSHLLIRTQSTDGPDTQSCRAHARQSNQRDPSLRSTCDQLILIGAAWPSNLPFTIPSGWLCLTTKPPIALHKSLLFSNSSFGCQAKTQLHRIYPTLTIEVSAVLWQLLWMPGC